VMDADGDPVEIRYLWRRNGDAIDGQAGPRLPATEHTRGDGISVTLTASDGLGSATAEATATIVDSPPTVIVTSAPTSADYGDLVTFEPAVIDPDEDPVDLDSFRFELTHGPGGMEVDAVTGKVSWRAEMPMFDRQMDVHWGLSVDDPAATPVSGVLRVTDPAAEYPLLRTGFEIPTWPSGLVVADLDDDGVDEMLILSNRSVFVLEWSGTAYRQSWSYPFAR